MGFIRIGNLYISIKDIISVYVDYVQSESYFKDLPDGGYETGERDVHYVRIVTRAMVDGSSRDHLFKHDTPQAEAILKWLEPRATKLA